MTAEPKTITWGFCDVPSRNAIDGWRSYGPKWAIAKHKKDMLGHARSFDLLHGKVFGPAEEKRYVRIERHCVKRYDQDNFIGGCKGLVDALVALNLLKDDTPEWVEVEYVQTPGCKAKPHCLVSISIERPPVTSQAEKKRRTADRGRSHSQTKRSRNHRK